MEYLTAVADLQQILELPIIKENKDLLWKMATSNQPVNCVDDSTWFYGIVFSSLVGVVRNVITPHMCQHQQLESYVQMHTVTAKTNLKEARQST
jgi:hypothetical protein